MTTTGLSVFDTTVQKTNLWLKEVMEELHFDDPEQAYRALRAVLHALRDRLIIEEAADLAAQLPMLLRGLYFEGWRPAGKPLKERHLADFLQHVRSQLAGREADDPQAVTQAVFAVLARHLPAGQVADIRQGLPEPVRALWPVG